MKKININKYQLTDLTAWPIDSDYIIMEENIAYLLCLTASTLQTKNVWAAHPHPKVLNWSNLVTLLIYLTLFFFFCLCELSSLWKWHWVGVFTAETNSKGRWRMGTLECCMHIIVCSYLPTWSHACKHTHSDTVAGSEPSFTSIRHFIVIYYSPIGPFDSWCWFNQKVGSLYLLWVPNRCHAQYMHFSFLFSSLSLRLLRFYAV